LVNVSADKSVYDQTMSGLKAAEEASAALQKKCTDADAMLEKKTQQVAGTLQRFVLWRINCWFSVRGREESCQSRTSQEEIGAREPPHQNKCTCTLGPTLRR
jgi:hypothetical protein